MHKVSVVRCENYKRENIRKALETSLRNINFKIKDINRDKIKNVLIKPNILSACKPESGIITHPILVEELCKILKEKGVEEIYICESSAFDTDSALKISGYDKLEDAKKGIKVINFEKLPERFFNFGKHAERIPLPKLLFQVDLVINFAKMKTHGLTQLTLCTKNLYGCIPGKMKENLHRIFPNPVDFSHLLVKIEKTINPQLNIIDAVEGIEGEGPGATGDKIKSKLIIAGKNACAADIIGSEIMGFKPKKIYTNALGNVKRKNIEVVGNAKNIRFNFKKPKSHKILVFMELLRFLPKPKIEFHKDKCKRCCLCEKKCPVGAIKLAPWPVCDSKKCIRCLCCIEICPNKAVYLQEPWIREIIEKMGKKLVKV